MSMVINGPVTVKVHGMLKQKQLQGSWGVMYDGGDKSHKLPRIDLFEKKGAKSPVHSLSLEHVKFSDKTYRQPEDHFTLSIKKEKHVFHFESAEDKEDWVHSLCHVSKDLWQQRAKAVETSDFDDSESNMDMSDNLLYDSADKVHQFKISINPTKSSEANDLKGHYMLNPTQDSLRLLEMGGSKSIHEWPYRQIRKYGRTRNIFRMEVGRRCSTGEGEFVFFTPEGSTLSDLISMYTQRARAQAGVHEEAEQTAASAHPPPEGDADYSESFTPSPKVSHAPQEAPAVAVPSRTSMSIKESRNSGSAVSQKGGTSPAGSRREAPKPAPRNSISSRKDCGSSKDKQASKVSSDTKIYETAGGLTAPLDSQFKHELHNKLHFQQSDPADETSYNDHAGAEVEPVSSTGDTDSNADLQEMGLRGKEKKKSDKERKKQEKERKAAEAKLKKQQEKEQKEQKEKEAKEMKEKQKRQKKESKNQEKLKGKKSFDLPAPIPVPDSNIYDEPELLNVTKVAVPPPDATYSEADEVVGAFHTSTKVKQPAVVTDEYATPKKPGKDSWKTHARPESENVHEEDYEGIKKHSMSQPKSRVPPTIPPPPEPNSMHQEDDEEDTYNRLGDFEQKTASENIYGMASGKALSKIPKAGPVPVDQVENEYDEADNVVAGLRQRQQAQQVIDDYEETLVPSHGVAVPNVLEEDDDYAAVS